MQCPSCQFENMPGVVRCGRCGGSVHADAVAIDIHPPRASARTKRWRRATPPLRGLAVQASDGVARIRREAIGHWQPRNVTEGAVIRRMIVPGWPQMYSGRVLRGKLFLSVYLVLLGSGLLFVGTFRGSVLLGLAVSCHVSSILDITLRNTDGIIHRLLRTFVTFVVVGTVIYLPLAWLIGQIASPQVIQMNTPPFQSGDVVLVSRAALWTSAPQAGDVVLYDIPRTRITAHAGGRYPAQVIVNGGHIDRILAIGGQKVDCDGGVMHVDGKPSTLQPLNPNWSACFSTLRVPEGQYLIVPSTDPYLSPGNARQVSLVSADQIEGQVYFRTQPLSRIGFIN